MTDKLKKGHPLKIFMARHGIANRGDFARLSGASVSTVQAWFRDDQAPGIRQIANIAKAVDSVEEAGLLALELLDIQAAKMGIKS